jgi:hypothetical protein
LAPFTCGFEGMVGIAPVEEAPAVAAAGGGAGGGAPGTMNGCLHDGHCNRLPATLSGACIVF